MSYPGLTGESSPLWIAAETGIFNEYGIEARLVYMEGGRLSIQSLLSGTTQFMAGDAVSALSAIAGGADIVLLASAKNVLPYVFAVSKQISRPQDLRGKIIATSQVGGRAGGRNMGLDPEKDVAYLAVGELCRDSLRSAAEKFTLHPFLKLSLRLPKKKVLDHLKLSLFLLLLTHSGHRGRSPRKIQN
jgi:hypothetical protein